VRRLPYGSLSFRGRKDQQLKIRGHRVEPAEIEHVLLAFPGVRQVAVVACEDPAGDQSLVAYIAGESLDAATIRHDLSARMPEWMCPRLVHIMTALPVTVTGKIDRRQLPEPRWSDASGTAGVLDSDVTATERVVAGMCGQLLGTQPASLDANFIELGGHSLKAAQLSTALRDQFGVSVAVPDVLAAPSLGELARLVDRLGGDRPGGRAIRETRPGAPSAIQRHIWLRQELVGSAGMNNLIVTVRLRGQVQLSALQRSLHTIELLHPALRTTFAVSGGDLIAVEHEPAERPLVVRQAGLAEAVQQAGARALRISDQPPWTYELIAVGPAEFVLLLVFHRIAVDEASAHRLLKQLAQSYSGLADPVHNSPLSLDEPPVAAIAERGDPGFWQEMLAEAGLAALPGQRISESFTAEAGRRWEVDLPGISAEALERVAAANGATSKILLLCAFLQALAETTGNHDVIIGIPLSAGDTDLDRTAIGQFSDTLPVRFAFPSGLAADRFLDVISRTLEEAKRNFPANLAEISEPWPGYPARDSFSIVFDWQEERPEVIFAGLGTASAVEFNGWSGPEITFQFGYRDEVMTGWVISGQDQAVEAEAEKLFHVVAEKARQLARDLKIGSVS
jgi:acyl carrier protein